MNFGGGEAFLPEIMYEKLTKCSNFAGYSPEKLTIIRINIRHVQIKPITFSCRHLLSIAVNSASRRYSRRHVAV